MVITPQRRTQIDLIFPDDFSDVWVVSDSKQMISRLFEGGFLNENGTPSGGGAWDSSADYNVGDIVSQGSILYTAISDNVNVDPSIDVANIPSTSWTVASSQERGGVIFDINVSYLDGDLVTYDNSAYSARTSNAGNIPPDNPQEWELISTPERGGVAYGPSIEYKIGDLAYSTDGSYYIAVVDGVIGAPGGNSNWESLAAVERGGVQWDASINYKVGDIVTDTIDGKLYRAVLVNTNIQPSTTSQYWVIINPDERGGVAYDATISYIKGDLVYGADGAYYKAIVDGHLDAPDTNDLQWEPLVTPERGGVFYKVNTTYQMGDIISARDGGTFTDTYRCKETYTSKSIDFPSEIDKWTLLDIEPERGGVLWDKDTLYEIGDVVTDIDGKLYTAIDTGSNNQPSTTSNTFWKLAESFEKGGTFYDLTVAYSKGDIVSNDEFPRKAFISLEDGNMGNLPPHLIGLDPHWQAIDTINYNAPTGGDREGDGVHDASNPTGTGEHCPWDSGGTATDANTLGEYPNTELEKIGAIWRISGLGKDIDGNSITYVFNTGKLAGMSVADGDTLAWVDGVTSLNPGDDSEDWLLTVAYRATHERGGVLWSSGKNYEVGDIVTDPTTDLAYIALGDSTGSQPSTNPSEWKLISDERGGVHYKGSTNYKVGDIITAEAYDATISYIKGDLVYGADDAYYTAITGGPLGAPENNTSEWEPLVTPERGGVLWDATVEYLIGDTVTDVGKFYTAILDSTGEIPSNAPNPYWKLTKAFEKGGTLYDPLVSYSKGDIISNNELPRKAFISLQDGNTNHTPPHILSLDEYWQAIDTINYNAPTGGDRDGDGAYLAIPGNFGTGEHCPWDSVNGTAGGVGAPATGANPNGEYPNTELEKRGAIWRISGLGKDIDGNSITYTFTAGNLAGRSVANGDTIAWVDGDTSANPGDGFEDWLLSVAPRATNERGGVSWKAGGNYALGDIVSEADLTYVHIHEDGLGSSPSNSPADWKLVSDERGGVFYKADTLYKIGDIITAESDDGTTTTTEVYRCIIGYTSGSGGAPTDFFGELSRWFLIEGDVERGGVQWQPGVNYLVNDLVVDPTDLFIYRSTEEHTSVIGQDLYGSPSETTGTNWIIAATLERGGVQWDATTEYNFGDLIYEDGIYYKRIGTDPTDPEQPSLTAANWERAICPCGYIVESNTTFAPDFKNNNFFDYTMTANTDFSEPSIIEPGVTGTIVVRQDDIGGHAATWSFHYLFPAGLPGFIILSR